MWNRELFDEEGIWLTTHVLSGNLAQVTVCVLLAALFTVVYTSEPFQQTLEQLDKLPGQQRWRLVVPFFFGFCCGELTIISIISKYIPSSINTVIQFRSGGFESLKSISFLKLRLAVDQSSLLFGSIFWVSSYQDYRSVLLSNVVNVILESWNLALELGYMIIRGLYFLLAATQQCTSVE